MAFNVKNKPLPKPTEVFSLTQLDSDTDFRGGIRVRAGENGYVRIGNLGKDANGNQLYGVLINDGTKNIFFAGRHVDGF